MKYYSGSRFRLGSLPGGLRLILVLYLVITLLGFWLAALKYWFRGSGEGRLFSMAGSQQYYVDRWASQDPLLAGEADSPIHWLIDMSHPHLFTIPIVLLVLCHLVQLCRGPQSLKSGLYIAAFGGLIATFGLPWLAQFLPAVAILIPFGGILLVLSGTALCVWALYELFAKDPNQTSRAAR